MNDKGLAIYDIFIFILIINRRMERARKDVVDSTVNTIILLLKGNCHQKKVVDLLMKYESTSKITKNNNKKVLQKLY